MSDGRSSAGWYVDPHDQRQLRWWDGETWTEDVHPPLEAAEAPALPSRRKLTALLLAIGGAAATVITAATIVIPIVADLAARPTSVDTLEVLGDEPPVADEPAPVEEVLAAVPISEEMAFDSWSMDGWAGGTLAVDAPIRDLPVAVMDDYFCTDEQNAWIEQFGVEDDGGGAESVIIQGDLLNTATSGGALAISNLRIEGEFVEQEVPRFRMTCELGGMGDAPPPYWISATFGDPSPAIFVEDLGYSYMPGEEQLAPGLAGTPFAANLEPGGLAQVLLIADGVDRSRDFVGRVVADVSVGDQVREVVLRDGRLQTSAPRITGVEGYIGWGGLYCLPPGLTESGMTSGSVGPDDVAPYACTPAELAERVEAEAAALGWRG